MSVMTLLRRWGPAVLLAVGSFGSWQAAQARDIDDVSVEPVPYELELSTPLLSARRIPRALQAPVVDDAVRPTIETAASQSPADGTCIVVQVDDRIIEPATNPDVPLVPASNQKILTTYVGLRVLGPDFRFRTTVLADAAPSGGVVPGNLYLVGDGDPFLATADWWAQYDVDKVDGRFNTSMEALADAIVAAGVTSITGAVIGDESLLDNQRYGPWAERLIEQKQSGPLSALTVNEGFVDWPGSLTGTTGVKTPTDNPPLNGAGVLARLLADRGVVIGAGGGTAVDVGVAPAAAVEVAAIESPPLSDVVTHINSYSSNLGAELLLKRIGLEVSGQGTTAAGAAVVVSTLTEDGVPVTGLSVLDGSGLAESDRVTCRTLASVLALAGADSDLAGSMSIGGERGSLLARFVDTAAEGLVQAKTGTLDGVTALSGYLQSATDPDVDLVFTYIANQPGIGTSGNRTDIQDPFVAGLTTYPGPPTVESLAPLDPDEADSDAPQATPEPD